MDNPAFNEIIDRIIYQFALNSATKSDQNPLQSENKNTKSRYWSNENRQSIRRTQSTHPISPHPNTQMQI